MSGDAVADAVSEIVKERNDGAPADGQQHEPTTDPLRDIAEGKLSQDEQPTGDTIGSKELLEAVKGLTAKVEENTLSLSQLQSGQMTDPSVLAGLNAGTRDGEVDDEGEPELSQPTSVLERVLSDPFIKRALSNNEGVSMEDLLQVVDKVSTEHSQDVENRLRGELTKNQERTTAEQKKAAVLAESQELANYLAGVGIDPDKFVDQDFFNMLRSNRYQSNSIGEVFTLYVNRHPQKAEALRQAQVETAQRSKQTQEGKSPFFGQRPSGDGEGTSPGKSGTLDGAIKRISGMI